MPAAEPVVKLPERLHRDPEPLDIPQAHPDARQEGQRPGVLTGSTSQRSEASFHAPGAIRPRASTP